MAAQVRPSTTLPDQVGLFATRTIPPGSEIISIDKPLLAVVDLARLDEACSNCFRWIPDRAHDTTVEQWLPDPRGIVLSKCLGCSTVKYCNKVSNYVRVRLFLYQTAVSAIGRFFHKVIFLLHLLNGQCVFSVILGGHRY